MLNDDQYSPSVIGLDLTLTAIFEFLPNGPDFMNLVFALKDHEVYKQLICEIARFGIWNKRTVFIDDLSKEDSKKLLTFLIVEIISQKKHFEIPQIKLCVTSSIGDSDNLIEGMSRMKELEFENVVFKHSQLKLLIENPYCKVEQLFLNNSLLEPSSISNETKLINSTLKYLKIVNNFQRKKDYLHHRENFPFDLCRKEKEYKRTPFCYGLNASFSSLIDLSVDSLENTLIETHRSQLQKLNLGVCSAFKNHTFDNVKELTLNTGFAKEIQGRFPHVEKLVVSYFSFRSDDSKLETVKELTVKSVGGVFSQEVPLAGLIERVIAIFPNLTKFTISDKIVTYMYSNKRSGSEKELNILDFRYPKITLAENKLKNITIIHSKEANKVVLHGLKRELQTLCPSTLIDLKETNNESYSFYEWNSIKEIVPSELCKLHDEICKLEMLNTANTPLNDFIGKFIACAYPIDSEQYVERLKVLLSLFTTLFSSITHYSDDFVNEQRGTLETYLSLVGKHDDFSQELERNINNLELITKKYGGGLSQNLDLTSQDKEAIIEILNNIREVKNQIYDKGYSIYPNKKLFIKGEWQSDDFIDCFDCLEGETFEIEENESVTFEECEDSVSDEESEEEECDEEIDSVNSTKRSIESKDETESNKKIKF
ncbi:hypothetical protein ABK040_003159 [Willaertia magna]